MSDDVAGLPGPVFGDPRNAPRPFRTRRPPSRGAISWLLVTGLALLVIFVVVVNVMSSRNDKLRRSGIRESGTITSLTPDTRYSEGRGDVDYLVSSETRHGSVDLGSDVWRYHVGQVVTVYYDKSHPTRMTIDDEDNQSNWSVVVFSSLLVIGAVLFGSGIVFGIVRVVRLRRSAADPFAVSPSR